MEEISVLTLPANSIITIGAFHINNSVLAIFVVSLIIILMSVIFRNRMRLIPGRFQVAMEGIIEFFLEQLTSAWGSQERARKTLPLIITIFLLILIANQFSLIPLVSSVVADGVQVLRTPTSDLTLPLTLAFSIVIGSHIVALSRHPLRHLGNFIKIKPILMIRSLKDVGNAFIEVFLGLMDIIGEMAKILSMSCRLFGNIFAGEVMIAVITGLVAYVVPMPFIFLSAFSGIVQAFVFSILALNFMAGIIRSSEPATAKA